MEKEGKGNQVNINGDGNRVGTINQSIGGTTAAGTSSGSEKEKADLRRWIAQNEVRKALQYLQANEPQGAAAEIVPLLLQRLTDLEHREMKGVISREAYALEMNQITRATLQIIASMP